MKNNLLHRLALWYIKRNNKPVSFKDIGSAFKNEFVDKIDNHIKNSFIILLEKLNKAVAILGEDKKVNALHTVCKDAVDEAQIATAAKLLNEVDQLLKQITDESSSSGDTPANVHKQE